MEWAQQKNVFFHSRGSAPCWVAWLWRHRQGALAGIFHGIYVEDEPKNLFIVWCLAYLGESSINRSYLRRYRGFHWDFFWMIGLTRNCWRWGEFWHEATRFLRLDLRSEGGKFFPTKEHNAGGTWEFWRMCWLELIGVFPTMGHGDSRWHLLQGVESTMHDVQWCAHILQPTEAARTITASDERVPFKINWFIILFPQIRWLKLPCGFVSKYGIPNSNELFSLSL